MTNPLLIPYDMRKRAELLRTRARVLTNAAILWHSRGGEQHAAFARTLEEQAWELEFLSELISDWAEAWPEGE